MKATTAGMARLAGACAGALFFLAMAGCAGGFGGPGGGGFTSQTWRFDGLRANGTVAVTDTVGMANAVSVRKVRWTSDFGGCVVVFEFDVQFSGSSVRFLNYTINGAQTTCAGIGIAQATGTGTANGSFGAATQASGSSTTIFTTPLGQAGGTANWRAVRL